MALELHLSGPGADSLKAEASALLQAISGVEPTHTMRSPTEANARVLDPIAVAALVLAVPGAITATLDLMTRSRLVERLGALLDKLRGYGGGALLRNSKGDALDLTEADLDEIMDWLSKQR